MQRPRWVVVTKLPECFDHIYDTLVKEARKSAHQRDDPYLCHSAIDAQRCLELALFDLFAPDDGRADDLSGIAQEVGREITATSDPRSIQRLLERYQK